MGSEDTGHARLAAIEAVKELRDVRDAYCAVEEMLLDATEPPLQERTRFSALIQVLNTRFSADLQRAEAAVQAV